MWEASSWLAWIVAASIFAFLIWDFFRTNSGHSEQELISSREGVDELFERAGSER